MLCWFTESVRTARAPPELRSDRHKDGRNKSLTFTYMKGGYSLSRAPKARAKKVFGIVGMKMCKITYLFTILLRSISLKNVKLEKPTNALAHEKVIFGVIWDKKV